MQHWKPNGLLKTKVSAAAFPTSSWFRHGEDLTSHHIYSAGWRAWPVEPLELQCKNPKTTAEMVILATGISVVDDNVVSGIITHGGNYIHF